MMEQGAKTCMYVDLPLPGTLLLWVPSYLYYQHAPGFGMRAVQIYVYYG